MAGTSGDSSAEGSNPGSAGIPLKVVLVEDTPADAYLNVMALEDEGFELDWRRVETAQELATALETGPDLVLADHSMPLLDSVMVIRQVRACGDDIPVVVVTGTIGEEAAVEIMRAGADDYVSKRVLSRLGPVVRRSLEEYRTRRERRVTARALKGSVQRYRALIEATSQLVWWMGADGRIVDIHESCTRFTGRAAGALVGSDWADLLYPDDLARVGARWRAAVGRGESLGCETRLRDRHGKPRWFDLRVAPVLDADGAICEWVAACTDIHDRKESARRIEESEVRYRRLFETAHDGIVLCDETTILEANPKACEIFGLPASELVGRPRSILDAPIAGEYGQSDDRAQELIREALAGEPQEFGWLCRRGDGQVIDCEVSLNAVVLADRRICQAIVRDVTEKKRIQDQARKLSRVVEASPDAILIADAQDRIEYVNPATAEVTGYDPAELMGRHPRVLAGEDQEVLARRVRETLARGETFQDVVVNRRKDGEPYYAEVAILPLTDEQGALSHYVAIGRDITEQLEAQEKLSFLAHHDPLTGLPNLSLLKERLGQALLRVKRDGISVLIIHLDLDRFRLSNELAGRSAGDAVLREVGRRLRDAVGDSGTVARLPGDEFVVKLRLRPGDDQPIRWVERLQQAIAPPVELEGQEFFPSACMGLAVSPEDGHDADTLLQRAETALHRAMPEGPVAYRFWSPELGDRARRMVCADAELRRALEKGEFELHYQPRADMESGRIQGTEALIRWRHPERGLVSPGEFIPLLEETGLVREVGEWVIREACRRARDWASVADEQHRVSVNVSARQLAAGDLEQVVARCLEETGCPGERLEVEITETAVMSNPALAATTLKALQGMGVTIALDDFGQGYSSLGYVKQFTPDVLKIDRAFVREVSSNPDDAAIARAIVAMGHSLRMKVVAEGVESESQLELLRRMGCDQVQGFLFSRPVPAAELRGMLESDRRLKPAETARGYMRTVLLVDDEPNVCAALARVLRADGYRILSARSAEEAFELLAQNPDLGVIVSDQRMPGMVGTDFLARVRELYPAVMRIVLSGYADVDTLTEAVNRGAVYKFLTKPWDNRVLRENIRGAFGQFEERWGIAPERAAG